MFSKKSRVRYWLSFILMMTMLFLVSVSFVGCDSTVDPLPEDYQGNYRTSSSGCVLLSDTYVSACFLYVNNIEIGGTEYSGYIVIEPQGFSYYSDKSFEFNGYAYSLTDSSIKGDVSLTGQITTSVLQTLDIDQGSSALIYIGNDEDAACSSSVHE